MKSSIIFFAFLMFFSLKAFCQNEKVRVGVWEFFDVQVVPDSNVFTNKNEILNGLDDDKNGYIDDIHGIGLDQYEKPVNHYFYSDDSSAMYYFHGSAVAFTIVKYNHNVELVGGGFYTYYVRQFNEEMFKNIKNRLTNNYLEDVNLFCDGLGKCVEYFDAQNVKVVNVSWYADFDFFKTFFPEIGLDSSYLLSMIDWMRVFHERLYGIFEKYSDIIFVLGAGNDNKDVDENFVVPACIDFPNVIVVGGLDKKGDKIDFSNFGKNVQTWALAKGTYKINKDRKVYMEGTSFSAPIIVAWVAEQIENNLTIEEIKEKSKGLKIY
ncbi:MAG: S8 family serine peptidase [Bacteroidales bacterium]|nr:S8 family serine peptidase [Bacteroidales bacterium]